MGKSYLITKILTNVMVQTNAIRMLIALTLLVHTHANVGQDMREKAKRAKILTNVMVQTNAIRMLIALTLLVRTHANVGKDMRVMEKRAKINAPILFVRTVVHANMVNANVWQDITQLKMEKIARKIADRQIHAKVSLVQ